MKVNHNGFARTEFKKPQYIYNNLNFYYKYFLEIDDTISIKFINKNGICSPDTLLSLITANIDSSQWYSKIVSNMCYESDSFVVIVNGGKNIGSYIKIDSMYLLFLENINENNSNKILLVNPNPANSYADITNQLATEDIEISVYDILTNHISSFILPANSILRIDLQGYEKGFYFLKYRYGCSKLIKL